MMSSVQFTRTAIRHLKRARPIGTLAQNQAAPPMPRKGRSLYSLTGVDNFRVRKASNKLDNARESEKSSSCPDRQSLRERDILTIQPEESLATLKGSVASSLRSLKNQKLQLADKYLVNRTVERRLGKGRHGIVRPALDRFTGNWVAAKSINKFQSNWYMDDEDLLREVKLLDRLKGHPNILHMIEVFDTPINLHIVTELCQGGDMFSFMAARDFEPLSNECVSALAKQFLSSIQYCHSRGVIHLDLKLENLMLRNKIEDAYNVESHRIVSDFVLIDFGHCQWVDDASVIHTTTSEGLHHGRLCRPMGSPSYGSPEMILGKEFSELSDAWSIGVILFVLMQGTLPFPHLQAKHVSSFSDSDYLDEDPFDFYDDLEMYPEEALDLLRGLLTFEPSKRLSVSEALNHPWLSSVQEVFSERDSSGNTQEECFSSMPAKSTNGSLATVQVPASSVAVPSDRHVASRDLSEVLPELTLTLSTPMYTSSVRPKKRTAAPTPGRSPARVWGS